MRNKKTLLFFLFTLILVFAGTIFVKVYGQGENTRDLEYRLQQLGIPVVAVKTVQQQPYRIEITLQSKSADENIHVDDIWNLVMTRRQATQAKRIGIHLDQYTIHLIDQNGKTILKDTSAVYASDLNQTTNRKYPETDLETTISLIDQRLNFGNLIKDYQDVFSNSEINGGGRTLILEVTGQDLEAVNQDLPGFLHSLFKLFEENQELDLGLAICHLRVKDKNGTILLDFVRDLETGISQWTMQPGVYDEWFPKPEPAGVITTPAVGTPGYPPPVDTLTLDPTEEAYPNP